eukprot:500356_1
MQFTHLQEIEESIPSAALSVVASLSHAQYSNRAPLTRMTDKYLPNLRKDMSKLGSKIKKFSKGILEKVPLGGRLTVTYCESTDRQLLLEPTEREQTKREIVEQRRREIERGHEVMNEFNELSQKLEQKLVQRENRQREKSLNREEER